MMFLILLLIVCSFFPVFAQDSEYTSPVKIPLYLSGSFAELRSNHFHSGIDIKTGGVQGIPVYAVADGHISRIAVSPTGFGLAVYIDHPDGTTSVFGHLKNFREDIARYVKNIQYEQKSFRVDLQVPPGIFQVKKDEFIANTGNTGSSGGPHLHFEIRDTRSAEPLNPLHYSFPVEDRKPPEIYSVMIVPLSEFSHVNFQQGKMIFPVDEINGNYFLTGNPMIPVYGKIGFAIRTNDFFDGSNNPCGVYSIRLYWDGELYYSFRMDRFSFSESRYINSHIDYEEYIHTQKRYHKVWIDPGNRLRIYDYVRSNGELRVTDGNIHHVRFEISDLDGNTSTLDFNVESKVFRMKQKTSSFDQLLKHDKDNFFRKDDVRIEFPEGTFYTDVKFFYRKIPGFEKILSDIHIVHENTVPLHKSARISVRVNGIERKLQEKALLVRVDTLTEKISAAGGSYFNGLVTGRIHSFGNYAVALDTIPPRIVPLSIRDHYTITESSRIRFRISDDLSGINEYEGKIDGKWALFEYDAKTGIIAHYFDSERFDLGKRHTFRLTVKDHKDNTTTYEASFWK